MTVDILTLFPEMFKATMTESILGRAQENGLLKVRVHNIRDFTHDKHNVVDDYPFGGGQGMVMKPEPVVEALEHVLSLEPDETGGNIRVVLTSPAGVQLTQDLVKDLAESEHMVIICGHYEGIDERVTNFVTDEISIGDYVLTGGELPAMVIVDSVARMIPGVLGDSESAVFDSFFSSILDYPHYTRPREWRGMSVPEVLVSGDHKKIDEYRRKEALRRTKLRRPDLLENLELTKRDLKLLDEIERDLNKVHGDEEADEPAI